MGLLPAASMIRAQGPSLRNCAGGGTRRPPNFRPRNKPRTLPNRPSGSLSTASLGGRARKVLTRLAKQAFTTLAAISQAASSLSPAATRASWSLRAGEGLERASLRANSTTSRVSPSARLASCSRSWICFSLKPTIFMMARAMP